MKKIILTIDYELFLGDLTGTTKECMIEPTQMLASILDKNGSKMTIFWDILHYYRLLELENSCSELLEDRLLIENQILELAKSGHDIQLHLHPHWLDAKYENNKWNFTYERFKLHNLSIQNNPEDINTIIGCVSFAKNLMEDLIRSVNPSYRVTTYRAGGYLIEPFNEIKDALFKNEIRIDSSVCFNLHNSNGIFSYDFCFYPNKLKYNFEFTPREIEKAGSFIEIPITTVKIPIFYNIFLKFLSKTKYSNIETGRKGSGAGEYSNNREKNIFNKLLSAVINRNYQLSTDSNFKERFSYILKKVHDYSTMIIHPKLLNSHTIELLDDYVSTNKIRFISIQDFSY